MSSLRRVDRVGRGQIESDSRYKILPIGVSGAGKSCLVYLTDTKEHPFFLPPFGVCGPPGIPDGYCEEGYTPENPRTVKIGNLSYDLHDQPSVDGDRARLGRLNYPQTDVFLVLIDLHTDANMWSGMVEACVADVLNIMRCDGSGSVGDSAVAVPPMLIVGTKLDIAKDVELSWISINGGSSRDLREEFGTKEGLTLHLGPSISMKTKEGVSTLFDQISVLGEEWRRNKKARARRRRCVLQ